MSKRTKDPSLAVKSIDASKRLAGVERVSFPITFLADIANSIRKRWGFFSTGSLIVALDRLGVSLRLDGLGQLLCGVSRSWIRRQRAKGNVYQRELLRACRKRADESLGDRMTREASERMSDSYAIDRGLLVDPVYLGVDSRGFIRDRY